MPDVRHSPLGSPSLTADGVAHHGFSTSFRGFDPAEVRAYLERLADELRAAAEREIDLRRRLSEAEEKVRHPTMDEATITAALGEETARILRSAHEAAADIRAKAEESVAQILRDSYEVATRTRAEAEGALARETEAAEAAAAEIRAAANADAAAALGRARQEAEALLHDVQEQAKAMVHEAQEVRAKVLGDLARRRRIAHTQVEQLRAGRDRLIEAYRVVRTTLDDVTEELQRAEAEARQAAEAAAARVEAEPEGPEDEASPEIELAPEVTPVAERVPPPEPTLIVTTPTAAHAHPRGPPPAPPAEGEGDPRRLSSLRLIRRPREAVPEISEVGVINPVEPPTEAEGVRVIPPESAPIPDLGAPAVGNRPLPHREPEPTPPATPAASVVLEDLFARIRAGREEAVEEARAVLADEPPIPEETTPEPAEATVSNEDEAQLQRRDAAVEDIQSRLARKLKRALQDEQNDVLDRLRMQRGRPAADAVLPPADEQDRRYREAGLPLLVEAAAAGVAFGAANGVGEIDVDDLADSVAAGMSGPLRRRLERGLEEGADEDASLLVERIGAAYREAKGERVERLAADHVIGAFSRGLFVASPPDVPLRWVVDDEGGPCPDCDDNALAGPTPRGTEYPTGQKHPPAHGGCRCLLVPAPT